MYRQEEGQAVRVSEAGTGRGAGVPRLGNTTTAATDQESTG